MACGASNDPDGFGGGGNGTGANGTGANGTGAGGPGGFGIGGGNGTGGKGQGGGCAGTSSKAEKVPLDMYVMLDQSGSMSDPAGGGTKWDAVTQAFTAFVQQPETNGIGFGLQYFGLPPGGGMQCPSQCLTDADCGACGPCFVIGPVGVCLGASGGDSCDPLDYSKPEIEIAPLPGVANAVIQSLGAHGPSTSTPTSPALQGAVNHAKDWQIAHPSHVTVAVFATDGDPSECDTDLNNINAIAAAAANGNPKILTFVIGVGPSLQALNGIAAAGGTTQAYLIDANANAQQQFLDALNAIQGTVLACQYTIPVPQEGTPDYDSVNVEYTPGGGGSPQTIPKVASQADCPPNGDAWYYDNNAAPTQIILCDSTCTKFSADPDGEVNIVLGCQTILN